LEDDVNDETATETTETPAPVTETTEAPRMYEAEYVERLRKEAGDYRVRAKRSDALARQAVASMVRADGRLIDHDDLAFDDAMLDDDGLIDADKVQAAIDALVERKPHLAAQRPNASIPQGARPEPDRLDLHSILRTNA
jgi:hypothetical protein